MTRGGRSTHRVIWYLLSASRVTQFMMLLSSPIRRRECYQNIGCRPIIPSVRRTSSSPSPSVYNLTDNNTKQIGMDKEGHSANMGSVKSIPIQNTQTAYDHARNNSTHQSITPPNAILPYQYCEPPPLGSYRQRAIRSRNFALRFSLLSDGNMHANQILAQRQVQRGQAIRCQGESYGDYQKFAVFLDELREAIPYTEDGDVSSSEQDQLYHDANSFCLEDSWSGEYSPTDEERMISPAEEVLFHAESRETLSSTLGTSFTDTSTNISGHSLQEDVAACTYSSQPGQHIPSIWSESNTTANISLAHADSSREEGLALLDSLTIRTWHDCQTDSTL